MPALHELQAAFLRAMLGPEEPELLEAIVGDGLLPAARRRSHRHVVTSLTERHRRPVVCRPVDERFFRYAAAAYIRQHPPVYRACLSMARSGLPGGLSAVSPPRVPGGRGPS